MLSSILSFDRDTTFRCESLVVGSGAGGALTASVLSRKGKDVVIIEEGPYIKSTLENSSISKSFPEIWRNGGVVPIISNTNMVFAEGRCLGGSTMVNSGLIHRLPAEIADEWSREFGIRDLEHGSLQKYHDAIEKELSVGVIKNNSNIANTLFKQGAERCGFKGMDVPVAAEFTDGRLKKRNMQETFLKGAVSLGARIITDCKVNRIVLKNNRAVYAEAVHTDITGRIQRVTIKFDRLFLCAGAIQTPLLLRRSGIRRNIGENINFHPTFRTVAEFDIPLNAYAFEMPSYQVKEFSPDISMGASVVTPSYTAVGLAANWNNNKARMRNFNNMATFYVMTRSSSKGKVRNLPLMRGSYYVRYELNGKELRNLSFGFSKLADVLFAAGVKRLYPSIDGHRPITDLSGSNHYLKNDLPLKKTNFMTIHAFSSCPMGEDIERCAVDSFGKMHGFDNIYINDASILPNSPGVNPQGPLMAIALRNLERFLG